MAEKIYLTDGRDNKATENWELAQNDIVRDIVEKEVIKP